MEESNPFCESLAITEVTVSQEIHIDAIEVRSFYRDKSWFPYSFSLKGQGEWMWSKGLYPIATVRGEYFWWTYRNAAYANRDDFLLAKDEHLVSVKHLNVESDMYPVQLDFVVFRDPELREAGIAEDQSAIIVPEESERNNSIDNLQEKDEETKTI